MTKKKAKKHGSAGANAALAMRVLRNPVKQQAAADKYGKSIEMQSKFLAAQRAINNRIQHDQLVSAGMAPAILPSKIHG